VNSISQSHSFGTSYSREYVPAPVHDAVPRSRNVPSFFSCPSALFFAMSLGGSKRPNLPEPDMFCISLLSKVSACSVFPVSLCFCDAVVEPYVCPKFRLEFPLAPPALKRSFPQSNSPQCSASICLTVPPALVISPPPLLLFSVISSQGCVPTPCRSRVAIASLPQGLSGSFRCSVTSALRGLELDSPSRKSPPPNLLNGLLRLPHRVFPQPVP